jgi:hypothetical protein
MAITPAVNALQVEPVNTVPPMNPEAPSSSSWLAGIV